VRNPNVAGAGAGSGSLPSWPPAIHLRLRTAPPGSPLPSNPSEPTSPVVSPSLPPAHLIFCIFVAGFVGAPSTTSGAPATYVRAGMSLRSAPFGVVLISVPIYLIPSCDVFLYDLLSTDAMLIETDLYRLHAVR
jgi:hypothetical protein